MQNLLKDYTEKYLNKFEVGYHLPSNIKLDDFWPRLLAHRKNKSEQLPLKDQQGNCFWYAATHSLQKTLHEIDSYGRDTLYNMVKGEIESELIKESLIEEAFYSSVIEGAFSTLKKAKALVEKKDPPKDNSEQMILNNFYAMRFILENRGRPFSDELILELHKIVTDKTLEDQNYAGRYRDDMVYVTAAAGKVIYTPPAAQNLPELMKDIINWVNSEGDRSFVHPVIKACVLHFYLVYLHPFFDGNGRTARALFYFYLIKNNYEFFKYFSISSIINSAREKYYKSIKDVEDFDSDLTYFLLYMSDAVIRAINEIKHRISGHFQKDFVLAKIAERKLHLNLRQSKFIRKFLLWQNKQIDIAKYQDIFEIVYQTARTDLLDLANKGLLHKSKRGKTFVFSLNQDF